MNEIILAIGLLALAWWLLRPKLWHAPKSKPAETWELCAYQRRASLFVGRAEAIFFKRLKAELPKGFHLFSKVRLEDILSPDHKYKGGAQYWRLRGRIKSRHVDYLVCREDGTFICAIELDGASHQGKDASMTDRFKDQIFKHADLPLYRVRVGDDFQLFCHRICQHLNRL